MSYSLTPPPLPKHGHGNLRSAASVSDLDERVAAIKQFLAGRFATPEETLSEETGDILDEAMIRNRLRAEISAQIAKL